MSNVIVRTIWGGPEDGRPDDRWEKVWGDVESRKEREDPKSFHVYVYGRENHRRLKQTGFPHVCMVDPLPYPRWMDHHRRTDGWIARPWRYKIELIREAVSNHKRIIACDWDVDRHVPPVQAFQAIDGRQYLLTLMRYKQERDLWGETQYRSWKERIYHPQNLCVSGCWMYLRGTKWIDKVLKRMPKEPVDRVDDEEIAMTHQIRDQHGGKWPGERMWLRTYESPIMVMRKQSPWRPDREAEKNGTVVQKMKTVIPFEWKKMFSLYR
jgi:hypothetical protein